MKNVRMLMLLAVLCVGLLAGCSTEKKEPIELFKADLDYYYGTLEEGVFQNDYVNISMKVPEDWNVVEDQMKQQMASVATDLLEKDPEAYENIKLDEVRVYNMLFLFKFPLDVQDKFNPSILSIVERLDKERVESVEDYLEASRQLMSTNELPMGFEYTFKDGYEKAEIGGKEFTVMEVALKTSVSEVTQKYYSHMMDDKILSFIVSHSTEEDEAELLDILHTLRFN